MLPPGRCLPGAASARKAVSTTGLRDASHGDARAVLVPRQPPSPGAAALPYESAAARTGEQQDESPRFGGRGVGAGGVFPIRWCVHRRSQEEPFRDHVGLDCPAR